MSLYKLISQEADWDNHQNDVVIDAPVGTAIAWAWIENVGGVATNPEGIVETTVTSLPLVGDAVTSVTFHPPDTSVYTVHAVCVAVVI